jgi:hypothetical protein
VQACKLLQSLGEDVAQTEKVSCVRGCVGDHLLGERPLRPVSSLESLVELDVNVLLQQRSQSDGFFTRQLSGQSGVE